MGAIENLTIRLPSEMADMMRGWVATGEYADISEVVLRALQDYETDPADSDMAIEDERVRGEIRAALDAYRKDPSGVLTIDQVRESLIEARTKRAARLRSAAGRVPASR